MENRGKGSEADHLVSAPPELLQPLTERTEETQHRPELEALRVARRYGGAGAVRARPQDLAVADAKRETLTLTLTALGSAERCAESCDRFCPLARHAAS